MGGFHAGEGEGDRAKRREAFCVGLKAGGRVRESQETGEMPKEQNSNGGKKLQGMGT